MPMARVLGPASPDLACDLVAAAVAEEYLRRDPTSRLDLRVSGGQGAMFVAGTVTSTADFDVSAVVRRGLSQLDPSLSLEPFISIEAPLQTPASAPSCVFGYATAETTSLFPPAVDVARDVARALASRRLQDADWFWLHPDFEVVIVQQGAELQAHVRAAMSEGITRADATRLIAETVQGSTTTAPMLELETLPSAGLSQRVGSSGGAGSAGCYGSALPPSGLTVGRELCHPNVLGPALARAAARELVRSGVAKAAAVELIFRSMESRPTLVRARDERGRDLSELIDRERLDLATLPEDWLIPSVLSDLLAYPFDPARCPPWER